VFGSRNKADMSIAVMHGLAPAIRDELLARADRGEVSMTTLAYLARLVPAEQVVLAEHFVKNGARGSKRFIECLTRPPDEAAIAKRVLGFVAREYPAGPVAPRLVAAALHRAARAIEAVEDASEDTRASRGAS
jgi:hypothetical protein